MLGVHHNICYTIFTNKYFYVIIGSDWHCMFFLNKKTTLEKFRAINYSTFCIFHENAWCQGTFITQCSWVDTKDSQFFLIIFLNNIFSFPRNFRYTLWIASSCEKLERLWIKFSHQNDVLNYWCNARYAWYTWKISSIFQTCPVFLSITFQASSFWI